MCKFATAYVADLKNAHPHMCYHAKFSHFRSNGTSVIKQIRLKLLPRAPRVKVTQGHRKRHESIHYLRLTSY